MDTKFIAEMLPKYRKHLLSVEASIEYMIDDYDKQLESLVKLDQKKYGHRVRELEHKKQKHLQNFHTLHLI